MLRTWPCPRRGVDESALALGGRSIAAFLLQRTSRTPHVAVRGKGWTCTIALDTFDVLAKGGSPPAKTVAEVINVLAEHQDLASGRSARLPPIGSPIRLNR